MIFTWTSQLLDAAPTGLTDQQLAALDLAAGTTNAGKPGPIRLAKFGFQGFAEYEAALESARAHVIRYSAVRGIRSIHDLPFSELLRARYHSWLSFLRE
ncbi:hypothetical protein SBA4_2940011 [Candidatus Sulfopaludibacter sp. SbA4]|nr:hypothetical protein SBA4_2940011 [Candidatus Sulfopaludibacter sp. SbA4]